MPSYALRIVYPNQKVKTVPLDRLVAIPAEAKANYVLIDSATQTPVDYAVLKQKGETLIIGVGRQPLVYINRFYQTDLDASFMGKKAADTYTATAEPVSNTETTSSTSKGWEVAGLDLDSKSGNILLGSIAVAGILGVALKGKKDGEITYTYSNSTINGTVMAGPLISGHDLKATVYKADGTTLLIDKPIDIDSSGKFSAKITNYVGNVIIKVANTGSSTNDYRDETTNTDKNLDTALYTAVALSSKNMIVQANVNPLTTIAYNKLGKQPSAETISNVHKGIAAALGIDNLLTSSITSVNGSGTTFNGSNKLDSAETYGAVLAALSGVDKNKGGTANTISYFNDQITVNGNTATISDAGQQTLLNGASAYNTANTTHNFVLISSGNTATVNNGASTDTIVYRVQAMSKSTPSYTLDGTDKDLLNLSADGKVTLKNTSDYDKKSSYSFTILAKDADNNQTEQAITLKVVKTANVVFDLVEGISSSHSDRTFKADTSYTIYVKVNSTNQALSNDGTSSKAGTTWGAWKGANNLGADDKVVLVGNGSAILGKNNQAAKSLIASSKAAIWQNDKSNPVASLAANGVLMRNVNQASAKLDLWSADWNNLNNARSLNQVYLTKIANNILTSQGLA